MKFSGFVFSSFIIATLNRAPDVPREGIPCDQLWLNVVQRVRENNPMTCKQNSCRKVCECLSATSLPGASWIDVFCRAMNESIYPKDVNRGSGRPDLNGVELNVITNPWPPYIIIERDNQGNRKVSGFSVDLLRELSELLNFRFVLEPESGTWGVAQADGNWTGMVGKLQRKESDMIIGSLGFQLERTAVMDFTIAFDRIHVTMWILNPRLRRKVWLTLFDMLDLTVIGLLFTAIFTLSIILAVTSKLLTESYGNEHFENIIVQKVFMLLGALLSQGSRFQPSTLTGKLIIATWWLFSVVFSISYSAMLIASLSANSTNLPFSTASAMCKQTEYKYGVFGSGTEHMFLQSISKNRYHRELWEKIEQAAVADPRTLSTDYTVHRKRVLEEKYVFIGVQLPFRTDEPEQSVLKFGDVFFEKDICIGLQKKSPYTAAMSFGLSRLLEHGIVKKLKKKWWSSKQATTTSISQVDAITINTLSGVFFTAAIGVAFAIVILLFEISINRVRKPAHQSVQKLHPSAKIISKSQFL